MISQILDACRPRLFTVDTFILINFLPNLNKLLHGTKINAEKNAVLMLEKRHNLKIRGVTLGFCLINMAKEL
ncbi:hypothetical protein BpHYR1_027653 [Brachionus plicatilis]|uniref:Uncharacterized protein n=1 Tax=Brachionus plicatilis TaxID=10195 RepID=A0A3M7S3P8_BRAPC|nr:hypothetical protein BpHYR1_027653 [Brachionus plicatilis]